VHDTRHQILVEMFPHHLKYRIEQCNKALFTSATLGWQSCTTLPKSDRALLEEKALWMAVNPVSLFESSKKDTMKSLLSLEDNAVIESVLMRNAKGHWTICISTQVGCAMGCTFCATGTMGLTRNLTEDEIVDQYRYWVNVLAKKRRWDTISNIVIMGMGEPLANFEATRNALNSLLKYTTIGSTHITVSSIGALPMLQQIIDDPKWPAVRLAISLHSAIYETRKKIVPTMSETFYDDLLNWCDSYRKKFPSRSHFITFEYVLLGGINDSILDAKALVDFVQQLRVVKVNLIPWNPIADSAFSAPTTDAIELFLTTLQTHDIDATRRKTMGVDIDAACGQLVVKTS